MLRTKRQMLLASGLLAIVVLVMGVYVYTQWWSDHYTSGTARLQTYAPADEPTRVKIFFTTGWQDIVEQPVIIEDARAVTIAIPTRVYVPCRECFKQASATLLDTTVTLRAPLGQRVIIDGVTGAALLRSP